jgi:tagatose 1,6-diphosphate aldolase
MGQFQFNPPIHFQDQDLEVLVVDLLPPDVSPWGVMTYLCDLRHFRTRARMGRMSLRFGNTEWIKHYSGHIGYSVEPAFRGNRYAERACRLIKPVMHVNGITDIWITCAPDNEPSRRTIERLGAEFFEEVEVPDDYPLPPGAIRKKRRYVWR